MDQDKRTSLRYDCFGEAMIIANPDLPGNRGKIRDLSVGGCKIEFAAPQKLLLEQRVEIIFCVHNLPFRLAGVVKGERGSTKYGFEFPPMRERVRTQLEELIDEMKFGLFRPQATLSNTLHC